MLFCLVFWMCVSSYKQPWVGCCTVLCSALLCTRWVCVHVSYILVCVRVLHELISYATIALNQLPNITVIVLTINFCSPSSSLPLLPSLACACSHSSFRCWFVSFTSFKVPSRLSRPCVLLLLLGTLPVDQKMGLSQHLSYL